MVHGKWMPQGELDLMTDQLATSFAQGQNFINLIRRNNVEAAVQTYHNTQKAGVPAFSAQSYAFSVLGGQLLQEKKIKEAIEIFKLNIEAYPNSANKYDRLANAYASDGNTKLAVEFYKKALAIDPKYPNAAAATEFIKKFG
jgi:tetratricopeptide (TPR) repeat protein